MSNHKLWVVPEAKTGADGAKERKRSSSHMRAATTLVFTLFALALLATPISMTAYLIYQLGRDRECRAITAPTADYAQPHGGNT